MLRASKRVLRPGGRTAFLTIFIPEGLTSEARERAAIAGPRAVATRRDHVSMLGSAGLDPVDETDVTQNFLRIARALYESRSRYESELRVSRGDHEYETMQAESRTMIAAIEDGLLMRALFVGERPGR